MKHQRENNVIEINNILIFVNKKFIEHIILEENSSILLITNISYDDSIRYYLKNIGDFEILKNIFLQKKIAYLL